MASGSLPQITRKSKGLCYNFMIVLITVMITANRISSIVIMGYVSTSEFLIIVIVAMRFLFLLSLLLVVLFVVIIWPEELHARLVS